MHANTLSSANKKEKKKANDDKKKQQHSCTKWYDVELIIWAKFGARLYATVDTMYALITGFQFYLE